jgi:hypothetical protein
MVETEHLADFIEEFGWLTGHCVRYIRSPLWHPEIADHGQGAKLPENLANIALSGQNDKLISG